MRNHALHPQPDSALALFLVPPDEMGAAFAAQRLFKRLDPQPLASEIRHRKISPRATSWAAELAPAGRHAWQCFPPHPRAGSAPCSSRGCASLAAGRPDFRFGLSEIGAFSSFLCWFWDFGCGEAAARKRLRLGPPASGPQKTKAFLGCPACAQWKTRRGFPAGLGHTPEGYLFIHESRFNVQKSQVA